MEGAANLIAKLRAAKSEIKLKVKDLMEDRATDIEEHAYRDAPIDIGQKISKVASNGGLTQAIEVNAGKMGAYVEFGTGSSAAAIVPTLPVEWQNVARSFYINGKGTLIGAPYLYPNYKRFTHDIPEKIELILRDALR